MSGVSPSGTVGRGRALVIAIVALAVGGLSFAVGVGSLLGQRAEASVLDASDFTMDPPAPLSLVSTWSVAAALLVLALIAWAVHGFARGLWLFVFSLGAIAVSQLLKQRVLSRPDFFDLDAPNTFPSGHMTVFAVVAGGLIWAASVNWRGLAAVAGAVLMGAVSWQLLAYGWHRPSDVLGAQALGLAAFALAALLRPPRRARTVRLPGSASVGANRVLGWVLALGGIALVIGGIAMALIAASSRSDDLLLTAGEVALVGTAALTARLMVAVAR